MKTRWVYILKGKRYYVWYTWNLKLRLEDHKKWTTKTTRELWDWEFVKFIECRNKTEAIKLEKNIKRWWHIERWVS